MMKAGIVAIVGRANTGKSTLLNNLVGEKVAIVSPIPQTTRHQIRAIFNDKRGQIVFLDTPGMHVSKHALDRAMIATIKESILGVDAVLHLVDTTEPVGEEEAMVIEMLSKFDSPVILGLNKIDRKPRYIDDYIRAWEAKIGKKLSEAVDKVMPVPLSALAGTNIPGLLDELFLRIPQGEAFYPEDVLTDFPRQLAVQDIIREKLLFYLKHELPFAIAVCADEIIDKGDKVIVIRATIFVERETQKPIVIGRRGEILKETGKAARRELEGIYEKKVFLELWVKVKKNWKQDIELLRKIGYIL